MTAHFGVSKPGITVADRAHARDWMPGRKTENPSCRRSKPLVYQMLRPATIGGVGFVGDR